MNTIFFHLSLFLLFLDPGSGIRDPGSGIRDGYKSGSGIRDKHPGSATLIDKLATHENNFSIGHKRDVRSVLVNHILPLPSPPRLCREYLPSSPTSNTQQQSSNFVAGCNRFLQIFYDCNYK